MVHTLVHADYPRRREVLPLDAMILWSRDCRGDDRGGVGLRHTSRDTARTLILHNRTASPADVDEDVESSRSTWKILHIRLPVSVHVAPALR